MKHRAGLWGAATAILVHGLIAVAVASVDPTSLRSRRSDERVEVEVVRRQPAPPPVPPAAPIVLPPPPERPRPRRVAVRSSLPPPPVPLPPVAAPPPSAEPPKPDPAPAAPTFGVRPEATAAGESPVAVPTGNTLMTRDRTLAPPGETPKPYAAKATGDGSDPNAFAPAAATSIADWPSPLTDLKAEYPPEARRLGLVAQVRLTLDIDKRGRVLSVRVVKRAGHGFDEAAVKALSQARFKPCKLGGGEPVDCRVPWTFKFLQTD